MWASVILSHWLVYRGDSTEIEKLMIRALSADDVITYGDNLSESTRQMLELTREVRRSLDIQTSVVFLCASSKLP